MVRTQFQRYELWLTEDSDGQTYTFFPQDNQSARSLLNNKSKFIRFFEAESWEEACSMKNQYLWGEQELIVK